MKKVKHFILIIVSMMVCLVHSSPLRKDLAQSSPMTEDQTPALFWRENKPRHKRRLTATLKIIGGIKWAWYSTAIMAGN